MGKEFALWQAKLDSYSALDINSMMLDETSLNKEKAPIDEYYPVSSALLLSFTGTAALALTGHPIWAISVGTVTSIVSVFARPWIEYNPKEAAKNETFYHSPYAANALKGISNGILDEKSENKRGFSFISKPNIWKALNPLRFFKKMKVNEYLAYDNEKGIATKYICWASFFSSHFESREYLSDRAVFNRSVANLELES